MENKPIEEPVKEIEMQEIKNDEKKEIKKGKTFKDYYQDPEFKRRHIEKLKEKVECPCGMVVTKSNMSQHRKTKKHVKLIAQKEKEIEDNKELELKQRAMMQALMKLLKVKLK
jgi:hypothetical protein